MSKKAILLLLDGLGDRSYARFNHKTPLQAAYTPALDRLAAMGANGLYHAARPGLALPSETAHFSLFGYDLEDFPGRGALEALGADIELRADEVAVLAHLAHVEEEHGCLRLVKDNTPVTKDESAALFACLEHFHSRVDPSVRVRLVAYKKLFGVIVLRGDVLPFITDSNPMVDGRFLSDIRPHATHADDPRCVRAAAVLKEYLCWAHKQLCLHPLNTERLSEGVPQVNGLVTQRAGQLNVVEPFVERYGLRGLCVAEGVMYKGLAKYTGMDFHKAQNSGDVRRDIATRLQLAYAAVTPGESSYDFVHVHSKAPDQAAHTKSPEAKKEAIEALDAGIATCVDTLANDPDVLLVVTADHSTPSAGPLIHSGEPVPMLFVGKGVRRDAVSRFDEISAATGALGQLRGPECLYMILNHVDRIKLQTIMDAPKDRLYWPGDYAPFKLENYKKHDDE